MERIVLQVDDATGRAYQNFSPDAKREFNQILSLFLKEVINDSEPDNDEAIFYKVCRKAEKNVLVQKLSTLMRNEE